MCYAIRGRKACASCYLTKVACEFRDGQGADAQYDTETEVPHYEHVAEEAPRPKRKIGTRESGVDGEDEEEEDDDASGPPQKRSRSASKEPASTSRGRRVGTRSRMRRARNTVGGRLRAQGLTEERRRGE